jgi:hypothetical protein
MNKILLIVLFFFVGKLSYAQPTSSVYFGQCMIDIESREEMSQLEAVMRQNPYLKVVRLDSHTKRAFILTNSIEGLTEEQFTSWFNEFSGEVRCIQIGLHGVDVVKPYPFEGCEN